LREEGRQGGQASSAATNVPNRFKEGAGAWQNT
jgi:hypothetical protein